MKEFRVFFLFFFFFVSFSLSLTRGKKNPKLKKKKQPEGETNPLKFSQAFVLSPVGGAWAVTNDVFRLNYA